MSNELRFSMNCDNRPKWLDNDNKQLLGDVDLTIANENTEYRHEWPKSPLDSEYVMPIFSNKSIKEIEAMYQQEPKILDGTK